MSAAMPTLAACPRCHRRAQRHDVQGRIWYACSCSSALVPGEALGVPEVTPVPLLELDGDSIAELVRLARRFPSLRDAYGIKPWDPVVLIAWLNRTERTAAARCAGRFILGLASPWYDWTDAGLEAPGTFNVFDALAVWDGEHAAAFRSWVEAPFQP